MKKITKTLTFAVSNMKPKISTQLKQTQAILYK